MPQLCGKVLGKFSEYVCLVFWILIQLGLVIVYWILMSNFLFNTVEFVIQEIEGLSSHGHSINVTNTICPAHSSSGFDIDNVYFNKKTAPLCLIVLLPIISMKSPTFFTKFTSFGILNAFFLIGIVVFLGGSWGMHANFTDPDSDVFVPMYNNDFPPLSGINAFGLLYPIITMMKNNRYQEKNVSYISCSVILYS